MNLPIYCKKSYEKKLIFQYNSFRCIGWDGFLCRLLIIIFCMIKFILNQKIWATQSIQRNIATFFKASQIIEPQKEEIQQKKPYELLLHSSLELIPKVPTTYLLQTLKPRGITRVMVTNHSLEHQKVLEAHIECLFALIERSELSIEGITLFVDHIHKIMKKINSRKPKTRQDAEQRLKLGLIKPKLLSKVVKLAYSIEYFYNQNIRQLLSCFIVTSLKLSLQSQAKKQDAISNIKKIKSLISNNPSKSILFDDVELTSENIDKFTENKLREIDQENPCFEICDFLKGVEYLLKTGYYNQFFLTVVVSLFTKKSFENTSSFLESVLKLRCIILLHKFNQLNQVSQNSFTLFKVMYPKLLTKYEQYLSNSEIILRALQEDEAIIQSQLIISFLEKEDHQKFKNIYINLFKNIFNTYLNGSINFEIKRLKGVFEVLLILCSHQDTPQVHEILHLFQKSIILYPSASYERIQSHIFLSDKYGFKSDVFAKLYLKHLLDLKGKIQKNKLLIHLVHSSIRQIHLAHKFLIYLKITDKPSKQDEDLAQELASSLFVKNIWHCLPVDQNSGFSFLNSPSFGNMIYFRRASLNNLSLDRRQRQIIQKIYSSMNMNNISPSITTVLNAISNEPILSHTVKIDHFLSWRQNPRARLQSVLKLVLHHYQYIKKYENKKSAKYFINHFLSKTLGHSQFQNILKNSIAYPGIIPLLLQLQQKMHSGQYPTLFKDIDAVRHFCNQQLSKIKKDELEHQISFQQNLDVIDTNKITIPFFTDLYNSSGILNSISHSLMYQVFHRYTNEKLALKMEIQTFFKYNKKQNINVFLNFFSFPHFADLKIQRRNEDILIFFKFDQDDRKYFLNKKHLALINESQKYWRKKKNTEVVFLKSEKEVKKFFEEKIKSEEHTFERLQKY